MRDVTFSRQARELLSRGSRLYPRSMSQRNERQEHIAQAAWTGWELADARTFMDFEWILLSSDLSRRSIAIPVASVAAPTVRGRRLETLSDLLTLR